MARQPPAHDLTAATGITQLSGRPVQEVADATLKAGASLVQTWTDLEPIVKALTKKVHAEVEADDFKPGEAARLLSLCATVSQKVGAASTGVLRASEGMSKLALLLDAGRVQRVHPREMTQKQLLQTMVATLKAVQRPGKPCIQCGHPIPIEVNP